MTWGEDCTMNQQGRDLTGTQGFDGFAGWYPVVVMTFPGLTQNKGS